MPFDKDAFTQKVEEFKECGHEFRYRDQIMVQEFSLSMIATGVATNAALSPRVGEVVAIAIQILGLLFLLLLTLHLRNTNQDRLAALSRKELLRSELGFGVVHQNVDGRRRIGASRLMVWFAGIIASCWALWTGYSLLL